MDRRIQIGGIVAALAASALILGSPSGGIPIPEPSTNATGSQSVEVLATELKKPRAIAISDDRIFVTEKGGKIRVIHNGTMQPEPLAVFRTADVFDGGLLGIALHPDFESNHRIYIYHTYSVDGVLFNKIVQITEEDSRIVNAQTIFDDIPGSPFSNGGVIKFGPDGYLYVATGAGPDSSHMSQQPGSLAGKILRLRDDGSIPDDNPFAGSPVYSMGHRNPQGMAWDGDTMYVTESGPTKNDEINIIRPGQNYGWPIHQCAGHPNYADPIACYDPEIGPGGIVIYDGDVLDLEGSMIMASLRATNLFRLDIDGDQITQKSILGGLGRIRDVAQGPDGYLYVITSNTDGRGFASSLDDQLVRIVR